MRKLLTVRTIAALDPIPGADRIERATIDGWRSVVLKGEFQVGDPCLYFEIDAFIAQGDPRFELLMKHLFEFEGQVGIRVRTLHLRKQISQGLSLPLSQFPEVAQLLVNLDESAIRETDFSSVLGIKKWERPIPDEIMEEVQGALPSCIPRTDQERLQNRPELLDEQANEFYEESIKLNGYSMTVFKYEDESGVGSKQWWFKDSTDNAYTRVAAAANLLTAVRDYPGNIAIQGELVGPGICKNHDRLEEKGFYLFGVLNLDTGAELVGQEEAEAIQKLTQLGARILRAPVIRTVRLADLGTLDQILLHAIGPSLNPQTMREGLVYRRADGLDSFKVISNAFLLENPEE